MEGREWKRKDRVREKEGEGGGRGAKGVSCLFSCSSKSHKIPLIRMHQNYPFSGRKKSAKGNSTSDCEKDPASFLDHFKQW